MEGKTYKGVRESILDSWQHGDLILPRLKLLAARDRFLWISVAHQKRMLDPFGRAAREFKEKKGEPTAFAKESHQPLSPYHWELHAVRSVKRVSNSNVDCLCALLTAAIS